MIRDALLDLLYCALMRLSNAIRLAAQWVDRW